MGYWILQSNPRKYRILDYIRDWYDYPDQWSISLYAGEIRIGDTAFIWKSNNRGKGDRGIYAVAEVIELPKERKPFERELPYWIDPEEKERTLQLLRLVVRYTKLLFDKPLLAQDMQNLPDLKGLTILRMPQRGIYKLTLKEGESIMNLVEQLESDCG